MCSSPSSPQQASGHPHSILAQAAPEAWRPQRAMVPGEAPHLLASLAQDKSAICFYVVLYA